MVLPNRRYHRAHRLIYYVRSIQPAPNPAFNHGIITLLLLKLNKGQHADNFKEPAIDVVFFNGGKELIAMINNLLLASQLGVHYEPLTEAK